MVKSNGIKFRERGEDKLSNTKTTKKLKEKIKVEDKKAEYTANDTTVRTSGQKKKEAKDSSDEYTTVVTV